MRMQPLDVMGTLYSAGGLRFGGFRTDEFLHDTEDLEAIRPGAREEIVAEAHYLVHWLNRFPEIGFVFGVLFGRSISAGAWLLVLAYLAEFARLYLFGPSPTLSRLCRLWEWVKFPLSIVLAVSIWNRSSTQAIVLIVFIAVQGWFGIVTGVMLLPLRLMVVKVFYLTLGRSYPQIDNVEGIAMQRVIDRWHRAFLRGNSTEQSEHSKMQKERKERKTFAILNFATVLFFSVAAGMAEGYGAPQWVPIAIGIPASIAGVFLVISLTALIHRPKERTDK